MTMEIINGEGPMQTDNLFITQYDYSLQHSI